MPILTCKRVIYFSQGDEAAFFSWLGTIKAVRKIHGSGDSLLLHVPYQISGVGYRELDAFFRCYKIDQRQLSKLVIKTRSSQ